MKRNLRPSLSFLLVPILLLGLVGTALATRGAFNKTVDYADITVTVNGEKADLKDVNGTTVEPFAIDGTTYLPVRAVADALGLDVDWDQANTEVIITEKEIEPTSAAFAETTAGGVVGYKFDGVNYFFGIPFAQAERYMPATAPDKWEGYLPCFVHGEVAPQAITKDGFDFMNNSDNVVTNEKNMFNLNVQTSDLKPATLKPVIFWIHGGGFVGGSSAAFDFYDGGNLAKYGDVVFISANHRLNALGYLDLSAYGAKYKNSGNLGIDDLVVALRWVKENAAQFGGDPNNVTIIGQSGGGGKVTTLMGVPAAKGLFHKAVALSGGTPTVARTTAIAQAETEKVLKILNITSANIDSILTVPYDVLLNAFNEAGVAAGPIVDGDYYPDGTYAISKDIPFLCGNVLGEFSTNIGGMMMGQFPNEHVWHMVNDLTTMSDEATMAKLAETYGANAEAIAAAFRKAYPTHKLAEVFYINNRLTSFLSADPMAIAMESYGGTVYQYVQAFNYPMFGGIVPIHTASCIPFWFHNLEMIPSWIAGDVATANKVSNEMATALVNFARTGNPSQTGLKWDAWSSKDDAVMVFDETSGIRNHHEDELFTLMAAGKQ